MFSNGVGAPELAIVEKAIPMIPSLGRLSMTGARVEARAKICLGTEIDPTVTVSRARTPELEPVPYWISHSAVEVSTVDESAVLKVSCEVEAEDAGTQRSADPVSKIVLNDCAGVPIPISP